MTRPAVILLLALSLAACDRATVEPRVVTNTASFDNTAAAQSIMQPDVVAESPPEPTPSPSPTLPAPRIVTVPFATGATLDAASRATLDSLVADLPADARLIVRGHSDSPGSDVVNLTQSRRRAEAVRAYLAERGIATDRVSVIALGERRPVAPNARIDGSDDPEGRARNRRAEIEVLPASRPAASPDAVAGSPAGG